MQVTGTEEENKIRNAQEENKRNNSHTTRFAIVFIISGLHERCPSFVVAVPLQMKRMRVTQKSNINRKKFFPPFENLAHLLFVPLQSHSSHFLDWLWESTLGREVLWPWMEWKVKSWPPHFLWSGEGSQNGCIVPSSNTTDQVTYFRSLPLSSVWWTGKRNMKSSPQGKSHLLSVWFRPEIRRVWVDPMWVLDAWVLAMTWRALIVCHSVRRARRS